MYGGDFFFGWLTRYAYQPAAAQTDAKGLAEERRGGADAGMVVGGKK